MNIDVFILARSTSHRLPRKHLQKINDKTIIENLVNRIKKSKTIRKIIVCTTDLDTDDGFVNFLKEKKIEYFRGSHKDILERLLYAAKHFNTDIIIDVSGDKIYTDPIYIDKVSKILQNEDIDFVRGNDSEIEFNPGNLFVHGIIPGGFKTKTLENICKIKKLKNTEDGYTEFFTENDNIKKKYIIPEIDFNFTNKIKLDLDYPEDLLLAEKIFQELGNDFHMNDILELFTLKPELIKDTNIILDKWKQNYDKKTSKFRKLKQL
jgi:spore coat polysaccharide biosynthesis protein SpsF (cytidylyltransferase family)